MIKRTSIEVSKPLENSAVVENAFNAGAERTKALHSITSVPVNNAHKEVRSAIRHHTNKITVLKERIKRLNARPDLNSEEVSKLRDHKNALNQHKIMKAKYDTMNHTFNKMGTKYKMLKYK